MAESLSDRQFESYRRIAPDRVVKNRKDPGFHSEEYAQAVVGVDGLSIDIRVLELLHQLLDSQRVTNIILQAIAEDQNIELPSELTEELIAGDLLT